MSEKLMVHFDALPVYKYASDYLTYCPACGTYNLGHEPCVNCGQEKEISIDQMAAKKVKGQLLIRMLIVAVMYILLWTLSQSGIEKIGITLFAILCAMCNGIIYMKYKESQISYEINKQIKGQIDKIHEDLKKQLSIATCNVEEGNMLEAYDRFRYLSKLIDTDEVRTYKLICLRNFQLRSDLPLEMNTLLQSEYNSFLIDYIYEISKIRKDLVDDATIEYVLKYQQDVLEKHRGKKIMASVLVACLKSKFLFNKYAKELKGYLVFFPKERLHRVCQLSSSLKDDELINELMIEVQEVVGEDKDFIEYF